MANLPLCLLAFLAISATFVTCFDEEHFKRLLEGETFHYTHSGDDWTDTCKNGKEQSPIALSTDSAVCDASMMFSVAFNTTLVSKLYNTGESLKADGVWSTLMRQDEGASQQIRVFTSLQLHFHAPSEHTINGKQYDLEVHIVHGLASPGSVPQRDLSVIGILFQADDSAPRSKFLDAINPSAPGDFVMSIRDALGAALEAPYNVFQYNGSLTTPPCSERVNWYVVAQPISVPKAQIEPFNKLWKLNTTFAEGHGNYRKVQPLNNRTVKRSGRLLGCRPLNYVASAITLPVISTLALLAALLGINFLI